MSNRQMKTARETAQRAAERESLTGDVCPVVFQSPATVLALLDVFDAAYKVAGLRDLARDIRMGGADNSALRPEFDAAVNSLCRLMDKLESETPDA